MNCFVNKFFIFRRKWSALKKKVFSNNMPDVAMIELTNACNFKCQMCENRNMKREKGFMSMETFDIVLKKLKEAEVLTLKLYSSGESMLHKNVIDMIVKAKKSDFKVMFSTNGLYFDETKIKRVLPYIDELQFSFYGWDKESYEKIYIGGDFYKVVANMKKVKEINRLNKNKTKLIIRGTALSDNESEFEKFYGFIRSCGYAQNEVVAIAAGNFGGKLDNKGMHKTEGIKTFRKIEDKKLNMCPVLTKRIGIYYDGRVTACACIDFEGQMIVGNILTQSIEEIRKGKPYQYIVDKFNSGDISSLALCSKCDIPYF